jgi:hypothetical protein
LDLIGDGLKGSRFSQLYQFSVTLHRPHASARLQSHRDFSPFAFSPTRTRFVNMLSMLARALMAGADLFNFAAMR